MVFPVDISDARPCPTSIIVFEPEAGLAYWSGIAGSGVVTSREASFSAGRYLVGDQKYAIPHAAIPRGTIAAGWRIVEGGATYTVIDSSPHRLFAHDDVTARNLVIAYGLSTSVRVLRPRPGLPRLLDGRRDTRIENYEEIVPAGDVAARFQPIDASRVTENGVEKVQELFYVFCETSLDLQVDDIILDDVSPEIYELEALAGKRRIDVLPQLTVVYRGARLST